MCFSELLQLHRKTFARSLCCLGTIYSIVLSIRAMYAQHSQASSDHWQLYVDHFKAQEIHYYMALSICTGLASVATLTITFSRSKGVLWTALVLVCLLTCVALFSLVTCLQSEPSHVMKNFILISEMWPFVALICVFFNLLYVEEIMKTNYFDWQYLTDKFTI